MTNKLDKLIGVAEELEPLCQEVEDLNERLNQLVSGIDDPQLRANVEAVVEALYDTTTKLWNLLSEVNDAIVEAEEETENG